MTQDSGYETRKRLTLQALAQIKAATAWSKDQIEYAQRAQLVDLVQFVATSVPYYRERLTTLGDFDGFHNATDLLRALPVLTRRDVQENMEELQHRLPGLDDTLYISTSSSGSTGRPVTVFRHAPSYVVEYDATLLLEWEWARLGIDSDVLMIRAVPPNQIGRQSLGVPLEFIGHRGTGYTMQLSQTSVSDAVQAIRAIEPNLVFTNGVMTRAIALHQLGGGSEQTHVDAFVVTSDRVDQDMRAQVRDAFGARIVNRYSCEEIGFVAIQCPFAEHLHVPPNVIAEIVNDQGDACEVGTPGRVLLTSLSNRAQPMIRYDVGDVAVLGEPCQHGIAWPVIESVEGRLRDGVTLPDGSFHMVFLYGSVLVHDPRVRGFAVLKFDNTIVACLTSEGEIDSDLVAKVQAEVAHMFKLSLPVVVRRVAALPPVGAKPRREWFPAVGDYVETMTDEQVLASAY